MNNEYKYAIEIMNILSEYGEIFMIGGCVRDHIMGIKSHDIDLCTNIPMEKIESLFETIDIGKNKDFGIVVVKYKEYTYEIANYRQDSVYSDGRHPDNVTLVTEMWKDVARRDLTINAIAMDKDNKIIDIIDGKKDIDNKIIRTVGNAENRFGEDYLRMLRTIRFSSRFKFKIEQFTYDAIKNSARGILNISMERITQELYKMAEQSGEQFADSIMLLNDTGLLEYILPEIEIMNSYPHNIEHHPEGNVYDHTLAALRCNKIKDPITNLAILFHDVGKPVSYEIKDDTDFIDDIRHTYNLHHSKGRDVIEKIANRMKFKMDDLNKFKFVIYNHMKYHNIYQMSNSKIYNLITDKDFDLLEQVAQCDSLSKGIELNPVYVKARIEKIKHVREFYISKNKKDPIKEVVNGKYVMELLNIKTGPLIGKVLKSTIEYILDNNINIKDTTTIEKYILNYK